MNEPRDASLRVNHRRWRGELHISERWSEQFREANHLGGEPTEANHQWWPVIWEVNPSRCEPTEVESPGK